MNGTNVIVDPLVGSRPWAELASHRNGRLHQRRPVRHPMAEREYWPKASIWESRRGECLSVVDWWAPLLGQAGKPSEPADFNDDGDSDILWREREHRPEALDLGNERDECHRRWTGGRWAPGPDWKVVSEPATSTTTAIPTSCGRTRALAKRRSGK